MKNPSSSSSSAPPSPRPGRFLLSTLDELANLKSHPQLTPRGAVKVIVNSHILSSLANQTKDVTREERENSMDGERYEEGGRDFGEIR